MAGPGVMRGGSGALTLTADQRARLLARANTAAERAVRSSRPVLASITVRVDEPVDPTAVLSAARTASEDWCALEQPDRDGAVVAGLGCALALDSGGPDRFAVLAARWRQVLAHASYDPPDGAVAGAGPIAFGGFAFDDAGGKSPEWAGFPAASLVVPELCIVRRGPQTRLTVSLTVGPSDNPHAEVERLADRVAGLDSGSRLPELQQDPTAQAKVVSVMPPGHYVEAVARAVERIGREEFAKIVLARAVDVHAAAEHCPEAVLGVLRQGFPECHLLAVGRGDATFIAATPELLVRRDGLRATTLALAGSARRSADPSVDAHLGEQLLRSGKDRAEHEVVTRRIVRTLERQAVWVAAPDEPSLAQIANIQHLATPIRAQLAASVPVLKLVGLLHPTPAVGGEPLAAAIDVIPALEGLDRGWYAGPIGWTDAAEDGEFVVGLRSALLRGSVARCYAGVGVVAGSDPAAELAETELKLEALLPVLSL
jgi:salicylate biosynthesis isochorismate synthase/menaquinone-specific isochorismate synthase